MAESTTNGDEGLLPPGGGSGRRSRSGSGQQAHEACKVYSVRSEVRCVAAAVEAIGEVRGVFGEAIELAAGRFIALLREELVAYALLDVVSLASEDQQ